MGMTNRTNNVLKKKFLKKLTSTKATASIVSSSLYSGIASAQRALEKPGSPSSMRTNLRQRWDERLFTFALVKELPPVIYHPWEEKYNRILTREKSKKSMTKDSYIQKTYLMLRANESIVTEEECYLLLIPEDAVHRSETVIHGEEKFVLPNIVRHVRNNVVIPSEGFLPQIIRKKPSVSQLQVETRTPFPMIGTNKNNNRAPPNLSSTNLLLRRVKLRKNAAAAIQRSPRRLAMETIREAITPLTIYG